MVIPSNDYDVEKHLSTLQLKFKQQLPNRLAEISRLWERFIKDTNDISDLENLYHLTHSLAGSAGTFDAVSLGTFARGIAGIIKPLLGESVKTPTISSETIQQISVFIEQLNKADAQWKPTGIPYIRSNSGVGDGDNNLVYLAEADGVFARELITSLQQAGYHVIHFFQLADFETACAKELPAIVIMDMDFSEGETAGANVVSRLKTNGITCPPLIFISVRDDIEIRLAAARVGARRYFCKPLDTEKLIETLDGLTKRTAIEPYRVLLIDDDATLLEYYAIVLREAGMVIETLVNPMDGLKALSKFKPDVTVMDVYMPRCSGPELAQVIRQNDAYAQMPIVFLSTETDLSRQFSAMHLGGDDFLVKPIDATHLVSAITARAERSRWTSRLSRNLQMALHESEFKSFATDQHNIVSTADVKGQITHVNDRFCEASGYSREELLGQNHRLLKSGFHTGSFYEEMWNSISKGDVWHGTICNKNKNGAEYWVESTIVPFLNAKGKPYKYVSVRTDVTALRESEERLNRSQMFANIGTWDWNIQTDDLFWSDRIWPLFGYVKEITDTTYDNFLAAIHADDRQNVIDAINNCIEQGADYEIEHRVVWPDGSIHWVLEKGDVVRAKNGVPLHMLGVVEDIDNRKRSEMAVVESERQLLEAQSLAGIGSWQADLVSGELSWSDEIYCIFGHEPGSFDPSVEAFHAVIHPDDKEKVKESERLAEKSGRHDVIHRIVQPNGTVRHVHELAKAGTDSNGKLIRMTGTVQDVTHRIESEQALLQAKEEAEKANRAKSEFLSSMSHELRTPMNAIIGFSQLLIMETDAPLNESQGENVDEIYKAGNHLLSLINEVLDLAKIEAGHIDLSIETIMVDEVIAESLQLIIPLARNRGIEISFMRNGEKLSIDKLLEQNDAIRADRTRLKQVFLNLLSNAIKYNRENGRIIIACDDTNGNDIRISVTDTGIGIPHDKQAQLFTAFNRLNIDQNDVEGTGIGLVITKNIIEIMGGNIGFDSQPEVGSTFWVELPRDSLPIEGGSAHTNYAEKDDARENQTTGSQEIQRTVLYIEDNPANLRLVNQVLGRRPNVQMWSAHEPLLGLELAAEHKPDLILLDINLPGMNGYDVLKHLRQRKETCETPVVAISANAMPKDIEKGNNAGFNEYITKPIDIAALLNTVDLLLQSRC